ncbi:protoglobin domain-containing protein [Catellatospora sp. NPDC049609]|uniref:protoglobin domain-containing protein n=1 Tax=Catellatospora sp. NPDC049609 TaxID=3155505 RepID=UPI0034175364
MTQQKTIPGYTYGTAEAARSPVSLDELARLKDSVLFGPADEAALHTAGQVLADQVEDVLDVWYGFVLAHPFLAAYFSTPDGQLVEDYARRVRARFGQWILDTCNRPYDQAWLDYAEEIGLRHTAAKKNATDEAPSLPQINLRYLIAFIVPITMTIRPFLARKGHREEEVEAMYQAWFKAVTMQAALWSRPYADDAW